MVEIELVEGVWLYHKEDRSWEPTRLSELADALAPWLEWSPRNQAWVADEITQLAERNDVTSFEFCAVPEPDTRSDRLAVVLDSGNMKMLRRTRRGGEERYWKYEWHETDSTNIRFRAHHLVRHDWVGIRPGRGRTHEPLYFDLVDALDDHNVPFVPDETDGVAEVIRGP